MLDTRNPGQFRTVAGITISIVALGGCLMQEEIDEDEASAAADTIVEAEYELTGSVGDGPVVGALMRVMQNDGVILEEFQSDSDAGYNIRVKTKGKYYPLTVDATDGVDLVTNRAPDFVLRGGALEPSRKYVVNLNPFSTLAMQVAFNLPGGQTTSNIYAALDIVSATMNFGLVTLTGTDSMTAEIDSSNVAELVKSSEAMGELVRRTRDWLLTGGFAWNGDDVVRALGADLIDGVIDGRGGPRADQRLAAIANIVMAQVLLESTANEIHVDGVDATTSLEMAIQDTSLGPASPALGELTATNAMLGQINVGLEAADAISDDARVTDLRNTASGIQAGLQPQLARSILPSDYRQTLDDVIVLLIGSDWDAMATVNDIALANNTVSADDLPPPPDDSSGNTPPTISGTPPATVTANTFYDFTPVASDADNDPLTYSVVGLPSWATFNSVTGRFSGTPGDEHVRTWSGIYIIVSDGLSSADLGPFSITVEAVSMGAATLSWQPPTHNEDGTAINGELAGYKIYWGTSSGNYTNSVTLNNPGLTTYMVENLAPGTYEFVATAFNTSGMESRYSNAATKTVQ